MVKGEYYQIGEVSKITGISKDTLHFYTKTGLLIPDYIDSENQYRYYSLWNLWQSRYYYYLSETKYSFRKGETNIIISR